MNSNFKHITINTILIFVMLSHITLMHSVVENYFVCYGNDGHIEVENINNNKNCADHSTIEDIKTNALSFSIADCDDVNFSDNCFEEDQFIFNHKISLEVNQGKSILFFLNEKDSRIFHTNFSNKFKNNILESYSKISLLI
ncbi:MAG: hypothetical protein L3J41_14970 [Melioribacteraceae bacterium]|nr:hypothetical protein [Melioribacteraceae bacterium]